MRVGVEEFASDTWVHPSDPIYPLGIRREGAPSKIKKRKKYLEEPICSKPQPYRPTTVGPLEEIRFNVITIKVLVDSLLQVPGEPSSTHNSYVSRANYDEYKKDQEKPKATIISLRKPNPLWRN